MNLWDRMPKESEEAHAAFLLYRDQPKGERSMPKVAQAVGKNESLLYRWSGQTKWPMRVQAWDEEVQRVADEAYQKELRDMAKRHAQTAVLIQNKALLKLANLNAELLTVEQVLEMWQAAIKVERVARGEPTSIKGTRQEPGRTAAQTCKLYADIDMDRV